MNNTIKALILGDIVGQSGMRALFIGMEKLKKQYSADVVIVNGENADGGFGITPELTDTLLNLGVDVITTGNHIWQKRDIIPYLEKGKLLRPANYPSDVPGIGYMIIEKKGQKIAVINLMGRVRLNSLDCPFKSAKHIIKKVSKITKNIIIDFHAEEPQEKEALAMYLDGSISALVGTHTHVQTSDEKILPGGTAYITDLGMTGPHSSVIGSDPEQAINRSLTQLPIKLTISEQAAVIHGLFVEIDCTSGKTIKVNRVIKDSFC